MIRILKVTVLFLIQIMNKKYSTKHFANTVSSGIPSSILTSTLMWKLHKEVYIHCTITLDYCLTDFLTETTLVSVHLRHSYFLNLTLS